MRNAASRTQVNRALLRAGEEEAKEESLAIASHTGVFWDKRAQESGSARRRTAGFATLLKVPVGVLQTLI